MADVTFTMRDFIEMETENELKIATAYEQGKVDGRADAIDEFDRICEEARSHKFGVCDAEFVIDVIKAKVKEQLKEKKNG